MKSCVIPVYFCISKRYTLDGTLVPRDEQYVSLYTLTHSFTREFTRDIEENTFLYKAYFRGSDFMINGCKINNKYREYNLLKKTVKKFIDEKYDSYSIAPTVPKYI